MTLRPGDAVGAFRIVGEVAGRRGVYRAVHADDARRAIVKVAPAHDWRTMAVEMLRAASVIDGLAHPGVARVLGRGALTERAGSAGPRSAAEGRRGESIDRRPWLATEAPDGLPLGELMQRRRVSAGEVAVIVRDVAEVLAFAHARGAVHRQLTPASITLTTGARGFPVCVGDWGDVRVERDFERRDEPSVFEAPEPEATGKVDVYALGVIAHRALTGIFPLGATLDIPGAPRELAELVIRMLALDPARRPTADEVAVAAARCANARPAAPPPIPRSRTHRARRGGRRRTRCRASSRPRRPRSWRRARRRADRQLTPRAG